MVLYNRANRRGKVDEIEDKESSDEEKKKVLSDDSDDDGFMIQYESVTGEDGGRDSGSISGGCEINHNSDRKVRDAVKKKTGLFSDIDHISFNTHPPPPKNDI